MRFTALEIDIWITLRTGLGWTGDLTRVLSLCSLLQAEKRMRSWSERWVARHATFGQGCEL